MPWLPSHHHQLSFLSWDLRSKLISGSHSSWVVLNLDSRGWVLFNFTVGTWTKSRPPAERWLMENMSPALCIGGFRVIALSRQKKGKKTCIGSSSVYLWRNLQLLLFPSLPSSLPFFLPSSFLLPFFLDMAKVNIYHLFTSSWKPPLSIFSLKSRLSRNKCLQICLFGNVLVIPLLLR